MSESHNSDTDPCRIKFSIRICTESAQIVQKTRYTSEYPHPLTTLWYVWCVVCVVWYNMIWYVTTYGLMYECNLEISFTVRVRYWDNFQVNRCGGQRNAVRCFSRRARMRRASMPLARRCRKKLFLAIMTMHKIKIECECEGLVAGGDRRKQMFCKITSTHKHSDRLGWLSPEMLAR